MHKYIVANWKSHKTIAQAESWFSDVLAYVESHRQQLQHQKVIVAVQAHHLSAVSRLLAKSDSKDAIQLAVQDVSPFPSGAYTGAVSASTVRELADGVTVDYGIVGHSERRRYFKEDHNDVAKKVTQLIANEITPIVCVDDEYISEQVTAIDTSELKKCVFAYEELGAIGTGKSESLQHTKVVAEAIKNETNQVPVLYGGSVSAANVTQYTRALDGVLIGSASLESSSFIEILKNVIIVE